MLRITIETDQEGLEKAVAAFVGSLKGVTAESAEPKTTETKTGSKKSEPKADPKSTGIVITKEELRAKLYDLGQKGKRDKVLELVNSYGATQISELPSDKYTEIYQKACEL